MTLKHRLLCAFARRVPAEARYNFGLDCIGGFLAGIHTGFFVPFYAIIARDKMGADEFMIALLSAGPYIGGMAALFYGGLVALNRELKWYWITAVLADVFITATALCSGSLSLSLCVFTAYAILACANTQYAVVVQRIYPIRYRASLMGYVRVICGVVTLLATLLAGKLMGDGEGWRVFFVISGLCAMGAAIVFGRVRCPLVTDGGGPRGSVAAFVMDSLKLLRENKTNTLLIILATVYSVGAMMQTVALPIFQVDVLRIEPKRISVLASVQSAVLMLSYPLWGRFIDRSNAIKGWIAAVAVGTLMPLGYYFAGSWTGVIWAHAMNGFYIAGADLAWFNMVLELTEKGKEGKYQALHYFFGGIRGMLGVVGGAFLVRYFHRVGAEGIRGVFPIVAGMMLLSVVFLIPAALKGRNTRR
ncbi:MAG: MFS transporter [Abditibacteriota bacterium]|nr:MFS transporter [Abditibacteriota bacterium]